MPVILTGMNRLLLRMTLFVWVLIVGCTSTKSINQQYSKELSQLQIGESLERFREILPQAVVAGQNSIGGKSVDAYEIVHNHMYDQWYGFTREERLWFYFHDRTLVKWGPPGAWPDPADLVVEHRLR